MENCCNLYLLSTVACKLAECLSERELTKLSSDLVVLSDMLANLVAHKVECEDECENECN